jgi:DNA-binding Lrp family transcriptional regulator
MSKAFVLVVVAPTETINVYKKLLKVDEVERIYPTLGTADFLLFLEGKSHDQIAKTVRDNVRVINGVKTTVTLVEDESLKALVDIIDSDK